MVWQREWGTFAETVGYRALEPELSPMNEETIFDLASLTKPLATSLVVMELVDSKRLKLSQALEDLIGQEVPKEKMPITLKDLMAHQSGLPPWRPFYKMFPHTPSEGMKKKVREWILYSCPLGCEPGTKAIYSDLGFMLLEWAVEVATGQTLAANARSRFYQSLTPDTMFFYQRSAPLKYESERFAATERCQWRQQVIRGVVHDENAYAMGGYSGHAGLFGTVHGILCLALLLMEHYLGQRSDWVKPRTVQEFFSRQQTEGSTWALGWDTPSEGGSSSGRYFSQKSVGHLGFTGCSLWMDLERALIVVLLTNRVHPTRQNEKIKGFRPLLHDLVVEELGLS